MLSLAATDLHRGRFVILAEPIPAGAIGSAWVAGACPVQVDVTDASHVWADVKDDYTASRSPMSRSERSDSTSKAEVSVMSCWFQGSLRGTLSRLGVVR